MPKFSIITAVFNGCELLDRTIESLRAQTCKDFQWVVVDGASTDGTVEKIKLAVDVVDEFISESDNGISDAWNKGLVRAKGEYVLILNAGDTYDPTFLEVIGARCDGQRVICSHARILSEASIEVGIFRAQPQKLYRGMHIPHNWCAVPVCHFVAMGGFLTIPLAMDFEWFHRYYRRFGAAGFDVVDQVLGSYHLGGKSDVNYAASFKANERILVENGINKKLALVYRVLYSLKHMVKYRLLCKK